MMEMVMGTQLPLPALTQSLTAMTRIQQYILEPLKYATVWMIIVMARLTKGLPRHAALEIVQEPKHALQAVGALAPLQEATARCALHAA
jgi:hypothetical protein